jgi:hypothetical protein
MSKTYNFAVFRRFSCPSRVPISYIIVFQCFSFINLNSLFILLVVGVHLVQGIENSLVETQTEDRNGWHHFKKQETYAH